MNGPAIPRALRFGTPLSLAFPASEIMDVQPRVNTLPASSQHGIVPATSWLQRMAALLPSGNAS